MVRLGISGKPLDSATIPLDGRRYICGGEIILRNSRRLRAHFEIVTRQFAILDRESVWCTLDGDLWYKIDEPGLLRALGVSRSEILPYQWLPDRPLDHHQRGPYPMKWPPK